MTLREYIDKLRLLAMKHGDDLPVLTEDDYYVFSQKAIGPYFAKDIGYYETNPVEYVQQDAIIVS